MLIPNHYNDILITFPPALPTTSIYTFSFNSRQSPESTIRLYNPTSPRQPHFCYFNGNWVDLIGLVHIQNSEITDTFTLTLLPTAYNSLLELNIPIQVVCRSVLVIAPHDVDLLADITLTVSDFQFDQNTQEDDNQTYDSQNYNSNHGLYKKYENIHQIPYTTPAPLSTFTIPLPIINLKQNQPSLTILYAVQTAQSNVNFLHFKFESRISGLFHIRFWDSIQSTYKNINLISTEQANDMVCRDLPLDESRMPSSQPQTTAEDLGSDTNPIYQVYQTLSKNPNQYPILAIAFKTMISYSEFTDLGHVELINARGRYKSSVGTLNLSSLPPSISSSVYISQRTSHNPRPDDIYGGNHNSKSQGNGNNSEEIPTSMITSYCTIPFHQKLPTHIELCAVFNTNCVLIPTGNLSTQLTTKISQVSINFNTITSSVYPRSEDSPHITQYLSRLYSPVYQFDLLAGETTGTNTNGVKLPNDLKQIQNGAIKLTQFFPHVTFVDTIHPDFFSTTSTNSVNRIRRSYSPYSLYTDRFTTLVHSGLFDLICADCVSHNKLRLNTFPEHLETFWKEYKGFPPDSDENDEIEIGQNNLFIAQEEAQRFPYQNLENNPNRNLSASNPAPYTYKPYNSTQFKKMLAEREANPAFEKPSRSNPTAQHLQSSQSPQFQSQNPNLPSNRAQTPAHIASDFTTQQTTAISYSLISYEDMKTLKPTDNFVLTIFTPPSHVPLEGIYLHPNSYFHILLSTDVQIFTTGSILTHVILPNEYWFYETGNNSTHVWLNLYPNNSFSPNGSHLIGFQFIPLFQWISSVICQVKFVSSVNPDDRLTLQNSSVLDLPFLKNDYINLLAYLPNQATSSKLISSSLAYIHK
jgi:hypothetical protein